jgi:hypothetical protein
MAAGQGFQVTGTDAFDFKGAASLRFEAVKKPNLQNGFENLSQLEAV